MIIFAQIFQFAVPLLFAITIHEVAHGWVALKCGDSTAQQQGRLTLNPIKHIDPVGTLLVPTILYYFGGFIFGWAKPVPISWQNLQRPQRDMALVAIAGPLTNLLMALLWAILAKISLLLFDNANNSGMQYILGMASTGILINIILMVVNLIPIPPLDGSRVITSFLPPSWTNKLFPFEIYGLLILIVLLATGVLGSLIFPIIIYLFKLVTTLFAL